MSDIKITPAVADGVGDLHQQWRGDFLVPDHPGMAAIQAPVHGHDINFEIVVKPLEGLGASIAWRADKERGVLVITLEGFLGQVGGVSLDEPVRFGQVAGIAAFFQLAAARVGKVTLVHLFILSTVE